MKRFIQFSAEMLRERLRDWIDGEEAVQSAVAHLAFSRSSQPKPENTSDIVSRVDYERNRLRRIRWWHSFLRRVDYPIIDS